VRFLAENYALIVANGLEPGADAAAHPCEESKVATFADRVTAVNPRARVLMYSANQLHHGADVPAGARPDRPGSYMCGLDHFRPAWRATYDNGTAYTEHGGTQYVHNLSIPAARAWWVGVLTNASLGANVAGVFADNGLDLPPAWCSPARARQLLAGQQALLDEVRAAGKYAIFNGVRYALTSKGVPRDDFAALDTLLPHASAGYVEPWLSAPYRDATTGALDAPYATHALQRMINVSREQPTRAITFKAGPGPCVGYIAGQDLGCTWPFANGTTKPVPNKMNGTPQTAAERRVAAAELITFPLATFLCAAGASWHLDYTWGYSANDFVPNDVATGAFPGQPQLQSNVPDGWYPDLLRAPGTPLGDCTYDSATQTFHREWTGVSVRLCMADETAEIRWK
jgi:hypothetical protein